MIPLQSAREFLKIDRPDLVRDAVTPPALSEEEARILTSAAVSLADYAEELTGLGPAESGTALGARRLLEELGKTLAAMSRGDVVETAGGLANVVYAACGAAVAHGIPLDRVFAEVHRANMENFPICPVCDGSGTEVLRLSPAASFFNGNDDRAEVQCAHCAGKGRVVRRDAAGNARTPIGRSPPDIRSILYPPPPRRRALVAVVPAREDWNAFFRRLTVDEIDPDCPVSERGDGIGHTLVFPGWEVYFEDSGEVSIYEVDRVEEGLDPQGATEAVQEAVHLPRWQRESENGLPRLVAPGARGETFVLSQPSDADWQLAILDWTRNAALTGSIDIVRGLAPRVGAPPVSDEDAAWIDAKMRDLWSGRPSISDRVPVSDAWVVQDGSDFFAGDGRGVSDPAGARRYASEAEALADPSWQQQALSDAHPVRLRDVLPDSLTDAVRAEWARLWPNLPPLDEALEDEERVIFEGDEDDPPIYLRDHALHMCPVMATGDTAHLPPDPATVAWKPKVDL